MAVKPLTPRQRQIFKYIKEYIERNDYPPVYEDIGRAVGLSSTATIYNHIKALEKKGYIKRLKGVSRGIQVIVGEEPTGKEVVSMPVLGKISGTGALLELSGEVAKVFIPRHYIVGGDRESYFLLSVDGDGLVSEGLLDGDSILFEYTEKSEDGDTALIQLDNGVVTIRKIRNMEDGVNLVSATSSLQNFVVKDFNIQGVVRAVFRSY